MINRLRFRAGLSYLTRRRVIPVASPADSSQSPIFIIGSGRSGNTLLRRGLVEHSALTIPPETYVLGDIIRFFYRHNSLGWNIVVKYALASLSLYPEFDDTFGISVSKLHRELIQISSGERSLRGLLTSFYRYYAQSQGVSGADLDTFRWGDKTPLNTYSVWDLSKVFPSARFIGMHRDPVDVVASYLKSGIYDSVESASLRWRNSNEILMAYQRAHPERCLIVRYEDLVRNYDSKVQEVCCFCDLTHRSTPVDKALGDVTARKHHENVLGPITAASIGKGRVELNTQQVQLVEDITANFDSNLLAQ